ncbi:hypothetical protein DUNSADRAFT_8471 [Dunaliella salina]|uniref:Encoded protein n=1 Tax=Dunaliella salina TaxID=3046 RepID=A0ABQ7GJG5_DUNSA|nr:hypothetical protein DUNSADRAFT_8471 [Dunaliella salina]|eukprot:KAF5834744.1 hypothetical protein DUNSADRAFT_8471 [Dunaliella salina]
MLLLRTEAAFKCQLNATIVSSCSAGCSLPTAPPLRRLKRGNLRYLVTAEHGSLKAAWRWVGLASLQVWELPHLASRAGLGGQESPLPFPSFKTEVLAFSS